jgi:predicted RNA-binding Zn ribbon-like protein
MDALCLDVLNSEWHDSRHSGRDKDRLEEAGWLEQLVTRWGFSTGGSPGGNKIEDMRSLRTLMQRIAWGLQQGQDPAEEDLALLNAYLDAMPTKWQFARKGGHYQLKQVSLNSDWHEFIGEVALSFARLLIRDTSRIKQCKNPDCRWFYYDESANRSRRWCDDSCANLMRVRRFRTRHSHKEARSQSAKSEHVHREE